MSNSFGRRLSSRSMHTETVMYRIIAVCFKKVINAPNQNIKRNVSNVLLLYRKGRKGNIWLFKIIAVSMFLFTNSNIYCIT